MRPRILWLAVLLLLAGCVPPLRDFGPEPVVTPSWIVEFDEVLTAKLPDVEPLMQVKKPVMDGDINLANPLEAMHSAWRTYLNQLHDARMEVHPSLIKGVELADGKTFGDVCNPGPNHRYPEFIQPTYCADRTLGDDVPALLVLPQGFTEQVQAFAAEAGDQAGWVLASLVTARAYATHLRHEVAIMRVMWPDGAPFDYCVMGMSLRSVFPHGTAELDEPQLQAVAAEFEELTQTTGVNNELLAPALAGYADGRLESCVV
jgi:hypothetical protein